MCWRYFIVLCWLKCGFDIDMWLFSSCSALQSENNSRIMPMEWSANGCKWSRESSPLVNCAKIGLSYFVRAINSPAPHGVCMINFSFFSKASWCSLGRQWANQDRIGRRHEANFTSWLVGAGRGDRPCPFIDDPVQCVKATGHHWQHGHAFWTLYTLAVPLLWTGHAEVYGPISLCHDESCAGVAVPGRQTASSQRGDGHGGRGRAAQRHDHWQRIQTPAEQPAFQRRVADFQEDILSDFFPRHRFSPGPAEACGCSRRRAVLPKDSLRGEESFHGELTGCFQLLQRGQPAVLRERSEHLVPDVLLSHPTS